MAAELRELVLQGVSIVAASGNDSLTNRTGFPGCIDLNASVPYPAVDVLNVGATNKLVVYQVFFFSDSQTSWLGSNHKTRM